MKNSIIVFDLDDTLINEIDYLLSAYKEIANIIDPINKDSLYYKMCANFKEQQNVFLEIVNEYPNWEIKTLLEIYRNHIPSINLKSDALSLLSFCKENKITIGIITDGRSITQRNKLKAINIEEYVSSDNIIISEEFGSTKPSPLNYQYFDKYLGKKIYIGDNFNKDFITPNKLNWQTIGLLDAGNNIHKQDFLLPKEYLPQHLVQSLNEIPKLLHSLPN